LSWIRGIYMNMEEIYKIYEGYKIKKWKLRVQEILKMIIPTRLLIIYRKIIFNFLILCMEKFKECMREKKDSIYLIVKGDTLNELY
jgi:hypothetical protein